MNRKEFAIILVLSVVVTEIASFIEVLVNGSIVAGKSGFPFRYGSSSLFGGSTMNYPAFFVDILFWFGVIWVVWKFIIPFFDRGKR